MTAKDSIEVSAATVDEAVDQALSELGATQDDVLIEVLSTPRSGLLGLGSRACARARQPPPDRGRPQQGAIAAAGSAPPHQACRGRIHRATAWASARAFSRPAAGAIALATAGGATHRPITHAGAGTTTWANAGAATRPRGTGHRPRIGTGRG